MLPPLLIVGHYLRRKLAQFKLRAHQLAWPAPSSFGPRSNHPNCDPDLNTESVNPPPLRRFKDTVLFLLSVLLRLPACSPLAESTRPSRLTIFENLQPIAN